MSEAKFVVGQWVTVDGYGEPGRIRWIEDVGKIANVEWPKAKTASTLLLSLCKPFVWQLATYKTTIDGVTATVDRVSCDRIWVACKWHRASDPIYARNFHQSTGKLCGFEDRDDVPHLLPYLADESPPVAEEWPALTIGQWVRYRLNNQRYKLEGFDAADRTALVNGVWVGWHTIEPCEPPPAAEAATYSEFEDADDGDVVNHPAHYTQHPSGVECVDIAEAFNFNIGNAIKYLWRAGLKGDALEDLRKAAWYVQREIERRAKR